MNGVSYKIGYPEKVREFCITLHYYSPRAYEYVREKFNKNLPHSGTIRAWYANCNVDCRPGITAQCLDVIKERVAEKRRNGKQLIVSISFDEVNIICRKNCSLLKNNMFISVYMHLYVNFILKGAHSQTYPMG